MNNKEVRFPVLKQFCTTPTDDLLIEMALRFGVDITTSRNGDYVYVNNNASTLAVCHLDTVADFRHDFYTGADGKTVWYPMQLRYEEMYLNSRKKHKQHKVPTLFSASRCVRSIGLDDRLGLYVILEILPRLGVKSDYLFTTGEEKGWSSANGFQTDKQYNWIYQFDRREFNPVLYQYDSPEMRARLESCNYKVAYGSYSDIADLEHLGVCGINFAVGYDYEHTSMCSASMDSVLAIAKQFVEFYNLYKDTPMPYNPIVKSFYRELDKDLNPGYFTSEADWDSIDVAKTQYGIGEDLEIACDFCGGTADFVVHMDAEYFLCYWCRDDLSPKPSMDKPISKVEKYQDVASRDDWDDEDYNGKTRYTKGKGIFKK